MHWIELPDRLVNLRHAVQIRRLSDRPGVVQITTCEGEIADVEGEWAERLWARGRALCPENAGPPAPARDEDAEAPRPRPGNSHGPPAGYRESRRGEVRDVPGLAAQSLVPEPDAGGGQ